MTAACRILLLYHGFFNNFKIKNIHLDPQIKWDICKIKIKELCIAYCKEEKIDQRNDMQILQTAHNDTDRQLASDPHNDELLQYREKIKQDLEVHAVHEAKSALVRSRIHFIEDGERHTKYIFKS